MSTPQEGNDADKSDRPRQRSEHEKSMVDDLFEPADSVQPPLSQANHPQEKLDRVTRNITSLTTGNVNDAVIGQIGADLQDPDHWTIETILKVSEHLLAPGNISKIEAIQGNKNAGSLVEACVDRLTEVLKKAKSQDATSLENYNARISAINAQLEAFAKSSAHQDNSDLQETYEIFKRSTASKPDLLAQRFRSTTSDYTRAQDPPPSPATPAPIVTQQKSQNDIKTAVPVSEQKYQQLLGFLENVKKEFPAIVTQRSKQGIVHTTLPKEPALLQKAFPEVVQAYIDSGLTALTPDAGDYQTLELMAKEIYKQGGTIEKLGPRAQALFEKEGRNLEDFKKEIAAAVAPPVTITSVDNPDPSTASNNATRKSNPSV